MKYKIKFKDEELKGSYANMMQVSHTKEEFNLDFFSIFEPFGILISRIISSPSHFKRMIKSLEENLKKYEGQFGEINENKESKGEIEEINYENYD
jgi:hypothetical protein